MNRVNFTASRFELSVIKKIVERAIRLGGFDSEVAPITLFMDLEACISNGCPLKLDELLAARDSDFMHDVCGISRHLDRTTGRLGGGFLPRYALTHSVSYPSNTVALVFTEAPRNYFCCTCAEEPEEETWADDYDTCARCKAAGRKARIEPDNDADERDWYDFIANLTCSIRGAFPTLQECDKWHDREDHVMLENGFIEVGVSEYCGLVSVWAIPQEVEEDKLDLRERAEYAATMGRIGDVIVKALRDLGQPVLRKVGSFSNGEGVYERIAA